MDLKTHTKGLNVLARLCPGKERSHVEPHGTRSGSVGGRGVGSGLFLQTFEVILCSASRFSQALHADWPRAPRGDAGFP